MKFNYFSILCFFLFSFSGLLKWIGLPYDPTVVFGLLTLVLITFYLPSFNFNSVSIFKTPILLFILFHFFYFFTAIYSPSSSYYIEKLQRVFLNLAAFIAPLVILRTMNDFLFLKKVAVAFYIIALLFISYNWFSNGLEIFDVANLDEDPKMLNYMSIAYFLGSFILFFHERKSMLFIKIISFLFIIILASKGALLFLIFVFLLDIKRLKVFKRENIKYIISFTVIIGIYLTVSSQNIFSRLSNRVFLGSEFENDNSSQARLKLIDDAFNLMLDYPIFGIGVGGFGILSENIDDRLSPHNILIEIFLESGLIGFVFLSLIVYRFYNSFKKSTIDVSNKAQHLSYLFPCIFIFLGDLVSGIIEDSRLNYFWLGLAVSFYVYRNNIKGKIYINE